MASIIAAGTTSGTSLNLSGDTSGVLQLATNGSTTAITISTAQVATFVNDAVISGLTVGKGGGSQSTNTVVGNGALAANTSGSSNSVLGINAMAANLGGSSNSAFGTNALTTNTSGDSNSAYGVASLRLNTTGANNTGLGHSALYSNTTASFNTAVGYQAGYSTTTGGYNTAVGIQSLYTNTTGTDNTAIGDEAGYLTTGGQNTFVGAVAGYFVSVGTKNTILGRYTGNQDSYDMRTLSNRVVISDGDGNRQLTMYEGGTVALDNAVPAAGTGITFPATQSASSNANTLDDYEEGTFSPTIASGFSSAPTSYATQRGAYTKIGRYVYFQIQIDATGAVADGSNLQFGGLPFTCANASSVAHGGAFFNYNASFDTNAGDTLHIINTSTTIGVYTNSGAARVGNAAGITINNEVLLCGFYMTT